MHGFWQGFRAVMPLWFGMIPFGLAYAVAARGAGLSLFDTQLMSVAVFAGAAQFTAAGLFAVHAGAATLVLTTLVINIRHLLYGLSLGVGLEARGPARLLVAPMLTDEAFGVTAAAGRRDLPFVLGAEASVFVVWNLSTLVGGLAGSAVPDPNALGVDFIFPLAFLALLIPLLRDRTAVLVALASAVLAVVAARFLPGGLVVLAVGTAGALLGAWWSGQAEGAAAERADGAAAPGGAPRSPERSAPGSRRRASR